MDVLYKTFPSQNKQYTWAVPAPYAAKLHAVSEFERLLENAIEKSIHQKCIEFLMIEGYKYLSPGIMNTIFKLKQNT